MGLVEKMTNPTEDDQISVKKNSGSGTLPTNCPSCQNDNVADGWIWIDGFDTESMSYTATCPKCDTRFYESYEVSGWEKAE